MIRAPTVVCKARLHQSGNTTNICVCKLTVSAFNGRQTCWLISRMCYAPCAVHSFPPTPPPRPCLLPSLTSRATSWFFLSFHSLLYCCSPIGRQHRGGLSETSPSLFIADISVAVKIWMRVINAAVGVGGWVGVGDVHMRRQGFIPPSILEHSVGRGEGLDPEDAHAGQGG